MSSLTEFLMARFAEDEEVAREAELSKGYGAWEYAIVNMSGRIQTVLTTGTSPKYAEHIPITHDSEGLSDSVSDNAGPHIARHDPARILAECEAKRGAIEAAWMDHCQIEGEWGTGKSRKQMEAAGDYPQVVQWLALPYADHPDYQPEWAP